MSILTSFTLLLTPFLGILISRSVFAHNLTVQELREYKAPKQISEKCPYYLAGHDYDGSPVWVFELGRCDIRSVVEKGPEAIEDLEKWTDQMFQNFVDSGRVPPDKPAHCSIIDLDGFSFRQVSDKKTLELLIGKFQKIQQLEQDGDLKNSWVINSNFLFQSVWNLGKPLLAYLAQHIEVFGTSPNIWRPRLLRSIPQDQLPEKYGGSKDFKPVKVYN